MPGKSSLLRTRGQSLKEINTRSVVNRKKITQSKIYSPLYKLGNPPHGFSFTLVSKVTLGVRLTTWKSWSPATSKQPEGTMLAFPLDANWMGSDGSPMLTCIFFNIKALSSMIPYVTNK